MKTRGLIRYLALALSVVVSVACKQAGDSEMNAASMGSNGSVAACQLSDAQVQLITSAQEFKQTAAVDIKSLPSQDQTVLTARRQASSCSTDEVSTLSSDFPSIAAQLPNSATGQGTATMALGDAVMGVPGVVRTEYIRMPTGSRYLAGYNSDGLMILLQRLLIRRP